MTTTDTYPIALLIWCLPIRKNDLQY